MSQIKLNGDQGEAIFLSVTEGQLFMRLEFPESVMLKGANRDNVQYFNSREFNISLPDQILILKFLEYSNIMSQMSKPRIPSITIGAPIDIMALVDTMPPQILKDIYEKIKDRIEQIDDDTDKVKS